MSNTEALTSPGLQAIQAEFKSIAETYKTVVLPDLEKASMIKLKYEGVLEYLENKAKAEMKCLKDAADAKKNTEEK